MGVRRAGRVIAGMLMAGIGTEAARSELVLAEPGRDPLPIVIFEQAPPLTRRTADELAAYLAKITGARPAVLEGCPDPLPESAIWIGHQPAMDALFPGVSFTFAHPEEILITANERHLALVGRDRWDPERMTRQTRRGTVEGIQQEYGTANAVYTFLQDFLGVRWLWPGDLGEEVPNADRIAFALFEHRYHPQIRGRSGIFTYSSLGGGGYGHSKDWCRLQRLQLSSLEVEGGHAFGDWWTRFHEPHPEFLALQPDGTRGGGEEPYPGASTVKLCKSNPEVWRQWLADVERQLEADPNKTVFNAAANDGWTSGFCVCDACKAWDAPEGERRRFHWKGVSGLHVALSDRQVTFANQLARLLKARHPGKPYFVQMHAYGHSRPAPVRAVPDDNVIVTSVANFLTTPFMADRGSPQGTLHRDQFAAWGKVTRNLVWRPNKARRYASMPLLPLTQTIWDFRFVAEHHCVGIYVDMVWEHWATRGPLYYLMAQMAWDPYRDGQVVLDDYYRSGFGKAAEAMRGYWRLMEAKWKASRQDDPAAREGLDITELFDEAFFAQAKDALERAEAVLAGEPERFRRRVDFVRVGLDYTRLFTEATRCMQQYEKSGHTDKAAEARARAIWVDEIMPLATSSEHPHAINWGPARPGHGHRSTGSYPADLHKNWSGRLN